MVDNTEEKLRIANDRETPDTVAVSVTPENEITETKSEQPTEATPDTHRAESAPQSSERNLLRRKPKPTTIPQVRDEMTVKIEKILEDGVGDAFARLTPVQKQEFKLKGEAVARSIGDMLRSTHVTVKKILRLILDWLKMLPGVNRFFLEQEAKIKTDRIIALTKEK